MLDAAPDLATLAAIPGNRLGRLHGDREGQHSIRINNQWRICFDWKDGDAFGKALCQPLVTSEESPINDRRDSARETKLLLQCAGGCRR